MSIALLFSLSAFAQRTTSFAAQWRNVENFAERRLPQSALAELENIFTEAQRTNNFPETVRAFVCRMRFTLDVNPDEAPAQIREFEAFAEGFTQAAQQALLRSMLAEMYAMYFNNQRWQINQRTNIVGLVPENIAEWSANIFFDTVLENLNLSLAEKEILQRTDLSGFGTLIERGADGDILQPTLFDFLGQRAITILQSLGNNAFAEQPTRDIFEQILAFRRQQSNIPALVFIELQYLDFVRSNAQNLDVDEQFEKALIDLKNRHIRHEAVIEVFIRLANFYFQQSQAWGNTLDEDERNLARKQAHDTATEGIRLFPRHRRINALRNTLSQITQKTININYPEVAPPNSELSITAVSRNIRHLQLNVYRVNATAQDYFIFRQNNRDNRAHSNRRLIETKNISIPANEFFGNDTTIITIQTPNFGIYEFSVSERGSNRREEQAHGAFVSSNFMFLQRGNIITQNASRQNERSPDEIIVLDRRSGQPLENVEITVLETEWGRTQALGFDRNSRMQLATNKDGFAETSSRVVTIFTNVHFLSKGEDRFFWSGGFANFQQPRISTETDNVQISLFTDRSLFRPGQTVYFKGIAFRTQNQMVEENLSVEVRLFDANNQEISKKEFRTNNFGSFAGEFVLPTSGLSGAFRIETTYNRNTFSTTFFVEEYRRPTFEVTINRPETEVFFGENVNFNGNVRAFAGHNLPNAEIRYSITRRMHHFGRWFMPTFANDIIASGTTTTDGNGNFEIAFVPERVLTRTWRGQPQFFTYDIEVSATDMRGETQIGRQNISIGDRSLFIIAEVPAQHNKSNALTLNIRTETINGQTIHSKVNYSVYRLEETGIFREKLSDISELKTAEKILSGVFDTTERNLNLNLQDCLSGYYRIVFTTLDSRGQEVRSESNFILFGENDTRPPVKTYTWLLTPKTEVAVGETAEIHFGTSVSDASVLYEIWKGASLIKREWLSFDNEVRKFEIPFTADFGDGVNVAFTMVRDEQVFTQNVVVRRRLEEKRLTPTLSVFRDRLQPGETAEWTITILESVENQAELLIAMYDASLDAIRPHSWQFNPSFRLSIPRPQSWFARGFDTQNASGFFRINNQQIPSVILNQLNFCGLEFSRWAFGGRPIRGGGMTNDDGLLNEVVATGMGTRSSGIFGARAAAPMMAMEMQADMVLEDSDVLMGVVEVQEWTPEQQQPIPQIRTNFNETAFFYPQLRTDRDGNVRISFTVPESLTRWNVNMLAHTRDLHFGQAVAQVVTQKDLMVQLNMPRFVRQSDKLTLVASVINLSDNALETTVRFDLINPETDRPIALRDNQLRRISLQAGETKTVSWEISEFSAHELLVARVVAQAGSFSDGEQHYLPVLPDKVLITETLPLTVRGTGTHNFTFESLQRNARNVDNQRLTVEFATNPIWFAMQALPTLSAPTNENAIDFFTAFYVNGLATHIVNSNPRIAQVFERWKREGGSREAFLSNLHRNTELKNMLLDETPWVFAARDEAEQKRQIALLFDLNQQRNQGEQFLERMLELQRPSGGFAWFEGMHESRLITQQILLGMARFNRIVNPTEPTADWMKRAIAFIDREIVRDYENLRRNERNLNEIQIGNMQWFYLHVRSYFVDVPMNREMRTAVDFYTRQAERFWAQYATLYGQAVTAILASRNGNARLANEILQSLRENALQTDEMGMFWARNTAGFFWNERPVFVQTAIIEAFAEINPNAPEIDEMKVWLLRQKQTQRWDTPISTVDAIFALLNFGSDWLDSNKEVEIRLNNRAITPRNREAGSGFFQETIAGENITPNMGRIQVRISPPLTPPKGENLRQRNRATAVQDSNDASPSPLERDLGRGGISWGAVFWQFKQDADKVEQSGGALSVTKQLFVQRTVDNQVTMIPIEQENLRRGDKVITRLTVTTDRDLEFVVLRDLRAAGLEPVNQISRTVWREGVVYREVTRDASTQFFFNFLPRGTFVFEHESWVNNAGDFANAPANIQSMYAPEFVSFSRGGRMVVENEK